MAFLLPTFFAITNPVLNQDLQTTNGEAFFTNLIPALITLLFVIGVIIFIFILLTGAISWISSGGDKVQVQTARDKVTQALTGLFILLALYAIVNLIEVFFGIDISYFNFNDVRI